MKYKKTDFPMQKNDKVELEITGLTAEGSGVGRAEEGGMAVFVPQTIPGERVLAHIIKPSKNYAVGKVVEILRPSPSSRICCSAYRDLPLPEPPVIKCIICHS